MFIADMGSGNSCRNSLEYAKRMVRSLTEIDTRQYDVVIKWQLFEKAGDNIPLSRDLFAKIHEFTWGLGYDTTASVFDEVSLNFLLRFPIPWIKLANRRDLDWMRDRIPDGVRVIQSVDKPALFQEDCMCCVSRYPAVPSDYERMFDAEHLRRGLSDHTKNWKLFKKYQPEIYECHFVIEHSDENPDGKAFARTPNDLREIL